MQGSPWVEGFPGSITVCDAEGIILEMNDASAEMFKSDGGKELIGKNVLDCHPEPSRSKVKNLLDEQKNNVYTIEKHGVKKLIYQTPWYKDGQFAGLVEICLVIPEHMPHFVRD
jgi:transcriptional regulator with PAS, ATPase and Fis domain